MYAVPGEQGVYGSDHSTIALRRVLYDFGADVVLAGGDRHYERFKPQKPDGWARITGSASSSTTTP